MPEWNTREALWLENAVQGFKDELVTCAGRINESTLESIDETVLTYLPLNFTGKRQIAIDAETVEKEQISDEFTRGFIARTNIDFILRVYYGNIIRLPDELEGQRVLMNLIDNYITDKIDTVQNGAAWPTWHEFMTGRTQFKMAWFGGGYGAEMHVTCWTTDINYAT